MANLNMLIVLNALLEENGVQAAADRLHLSAPAVSRTLTRIRRAMGDEILVRTGNTMRPTPRAMAVRDEVRALVQQANAVLSPVGELDLASLRRIFTIRGPDAVLAELSIRLVGCLSEAPGVTFQFLPDSMTDASELARGNVDLDLGATRPTISAISHEIVGYDRPVVVFRAGHAVEEFSVECLAAADHVVVSQEGRHQDGVDDILARHGLRRRVVSVAHSAGLALRMVANSDVVAVVPDRITARARDELGVRSHLLDSGPPSLPVVMSWHERYGPDPAHRWLRERIGATLRSVLDATREEHMSVKVVDATGQISVPGKGSS